MAVNNKTSDPALPDKLQQVERLERTIRAANAQRTLYGGVLAGKLGMHHTDLECLFMITLIDQATPGRLAQETGLTSGAITGVVDRLERAGYIKRERDTGDRRRVFLVPIMERIEEVRAINKKTNAPWLEELAGYSDSELELLLGFAERSLDAAVSATIALRDMAIRSDK